MKSSGTCSEPHICRRKALLPLRKATKFSSDSRGPLTVSFSDEFRSTLGVRKERRRLRHETQRKHTRQTAVAYHSATPQMYSSAAGSSAAKATSSSL